MLIWVVAYIFFLIIKGNLKENVIQIHVLITKTNTNFNWNVFQIFCFCQNGQSLIEKKNGVYNMSWCVNNNCIEMKRNRWEKLCVFGISFLQTLLGETLEMWYQ